MRRESQYFSLLTINSTFFFVFSLKSARLYHGRLGEFYALPQWRFVLEIVDVKFKREKIVEFLSIRMLCQASSLDFFSQLRAKVFFT